MDTKREDRIAELEDLLVETERQLIVLHQGGGDVSAPPPPPLPPPPSAPRPPLPPQPTPPPAAPEPFQMPGAELLLRYGGIALVVASAIFFVSTAVSRGWIGPTAQLTLATITSVLMIAQSFRFSEGRRPWSVTMAIGGAASLFVSGVVGFVGLDLLSFTAAVGWLIASVAVFLVLSRMHDAESIAIASVPATLFGVILLRLGSWYDPALLCVLGSIYLLGIVGTTHARSWNLARTVGSVVGAMVAGLGILATIDSDASTTTIITLTAATIVSIFIAAASQASDFRSVEGHEPPSVIALFEARTAALTIPWSAVLIGAVVADRDVLTLDVFWIIAAAAALLGGAAWLIRSIPLTMRILHVAGAVSTVALALLAVADGPVLLAGILAQALLTGWLAYRFRTVDMLVVAVVLGALTGLITSVMLINGTFFSGISIADSVAVLAVVAASGLIAWIARRDGHTDLGWIVTWLLALGWAAATFRDVPQGQMIVSLVWAVIGVALVVFGSRLLETSAVQAGFATLVVTAGKLIFVDLIAVDVLWRSALFFVIGLMFLRLAFVLPKLAQDRALEQDIESDARVS